MAQEIADSKLIDTWGSSGAKIEPDISKIIEGWQLGEQPPHEYMNWLQNTFGSKLNHILKNGVAKWNDETEYLAGATIQHNGSVWICKTTNKNSVPTDLNSNWDKIPSLENLALTVDTINDFPSGATTGDTCIVKDLDRGGIFIYDSTKVAESNNGTNFNGWIRQYSGAVNVKWFGAKGDWDGTTGTDDTVAIQSAVSFCLSVRHPLEWGNATFLVSDNIQNLWDIKNIGAGRVSNGINTWYVEPTNDEISIIYVKQGGLISNDGISENTATTMQGAINKLSKIGDKAQNGTWRIQLLASGGTIQGGGVKLSGDTESLPVFKNALQIWGESEGFTTLPTVIWNGESGTEPYAFRIEHTQTIVNIHFRHIRFTNWNRDAVNANAVYPSGNDGGGILIWNDGTVIVENCHADNCYVGFWYNRIRLKQTFGIVSNCVAYGISPQYHSKGNIGAIGGLNSGGIDFINCQIGAAVGRNSICYIQGSSFTNMGTCIDVNRESRIRTQDNSFISWSYTVVSCSLNSAWTPDNNTGFPDNYSAGVLSTNTPAYKATSGGVHLLVDRLSQRSLHVVSSGIVSISNQSGIQTLLSDPTFSSQDNATTWVPFRLPSWFLYSPTALLEVDLSLTLDANAGGILTLNGEGDSASATIASVVIPTSTESRVVRCIITAKQYTTTVMRVYISIPELGIWTQTNSPSLNISALRSNSEKEKLFRLYWTPSDANRTQFYAMRTYTES